MYTEDLTEPNRLYKERLQAEFAEKVNAAWKELLAASGVDPATNRELVSTYNEKAAVAKDNRSAAGTQKTLKGILIAAIIVVFAVALIALFIVETTLARVLWILLPLAAIGVCFYLLVKKVTPKLKSLTQAQAELDTRAENALADCWNQMAPLNALFDADVTRRLINEVLPMITVDKNLDMRRMELINTRYGTYDNTDDNRSSLALATGEIHGNPFIIKRDLCCTEGTETYTGSRVVTWTETYYDSEGHSHTTTRSETLTAYLTKMKPFYTEECSLLFASEAVPNLSFSRTPNHLHQLSEREYEKYIKKESKSLRKEAERAVKDGRSFTLLANEEFEAAFHAVDRDNEQEFRMLFTPLAMQNLLDLLKNSPYGDDFIYEKRQMLNYVTPEHTKDWNMDLDVRSFRNYDIDACADHFVNFNGDYFKHFFYTLAPVLSIPLYQQYRTHEYIYRDSYPQNYPAFESEILANRMGHQHFSHPQTATPAILKTAHEKKDEVTDSVLVSAFSYRTETHITEVPVHCIGNGRVYDVPVEWVEYIPVASEVPMDMAALDRTDWQLERDMQTEEFAAFSASHNNAFSFADGLCAFLHTDAPFSADELNRIFKKDC